MPAAAPAAPPAAPAPAATPAAPQGGGNGSPNVTAPKTAFDEAFERLEAISKPASADTPPLPPHPAQKKPAAPENKEQPPAPKEEPPAANEDDDEFTPEAKEQPKPEQKEQKEQKENIPPGMKRGDFLRQELSKTRTERDTLKAEIQKLKTAEHPEVKTLKEKIAAMEKRHSEIEDDYRLYDYERSTDYKEKFLKPYHDAYTRGVKKAMGLQVTTPEGTLRPATQEDFASVVTTQNDDQATRLAEELFGRNAAIVIHHRERILEANEARANAINEAKTSGAAKLKEQQENTTKSMEAYKNSFSSEVTSRETKLEYLQSKEGDAAWNDALARGTDLADKSWKNRQAKTPEEQAAIDAANYNRARAYSPLKLSVKRLSEKVASLEKELAGYKKSEPGNGEGKAAPEGRQQPPASTLDGVFAEIEKKGKDKVTFY